MADAEEPIKVMETAGHTMLLSGQHTRATYGILEAWEDENDLVDNQYLGLGTDPGDGVCISETQRRLYQFLVRCTELILHDINLSAIELSDPKLTVSNIKSTERMDIRRNCWSRPNGCQSQG